MTIPPGEGRYILSLYNTLRHFATIYESLSRNFTTTPNPLILKSMKIFLGADHGGFYLKEKLEAYLSKRGYDWEDVGGKEYDPADDFPQFAQMAVTKMLGVEDKDDPRAILICTGGQGMAMAANRFKGIRAAVIWDSFEAKECRNDNNSNVLCLPARVVDPKGEEHDNWQDIVDTWLTTPFAGAERFIRRNAELDTF